MDVDNFIFTSREDAETAMKEADRFWLDQRYTGEEDYIPEGKIYGVEIIGDQIEICDFPDAKFFSVFNEYCEYMVNKETLQWELVA
jgi:hypothetical protein